MLCVCMYVCIAFNRNAEFVIGLVIFFLKNDFWRITLLAYNWESYFKS